MEAEVIGVLTDGDVRFSRENGYLPANPLLKADAVGAEHGAPHHGEGLKSGAYP